jgi:hypothetical protein
VADWYFIQNDREIGPVPLELLQQAVSTGQVLPTDLVWHTGMADWLPVKKVPELGGGKKFGLFGGGKKAEAAKPGQPGAAPVPTRGPSYAEEARTALRYAIIGYLCCGLLAIYGGIKGLNARSAMAASGNFDGHGTAIAAIVIGFSNVVFMILGLILYFLGVIAVPKS